MPNDLYIDFETRCLVDITRGTDLYARAAEATICTYGLNDGTVQCWDILDQPGMPADLAGYLADPTVKLIAHQSPFDRAIMLYALRVYTPIERWIDTRSQAYSHGLPGSLELLGLVLGLDIAEQKMAAEGKRLIDVFCVPQLGKDGGQPYFIQPCDAPEDWETFKRYAVRDTESLRAIYRKLPKTNFEGDNLACWWLDQRINIRGFGFDVDLARSAHAFLATAKDQSDRSLATATSGKVTAATQRDRFLTYLQTVLKLDIPNMKASELRTMLESDDLSPQARYLLETRLEAGKSSGSKYRRGLEILGPENRIRYGLQFGGAGRTGRWSGKGFQVQNMSRPALTVRRESGRVELVPVKAKYIDEVILPGIYSREALRNPEVYGGPNEACALALRHVILASPGNELVVCDWSNIESRILAWIAGEEWKLSAYKAADRGEGADLYKMLFSSFFGTAIEDVNDTERQSGKVSELAFGYGGGVGALVTMAAGYQMDLEPLAKLVLPRAEPEARVKAEKAWRRAFLRNEDYLLEPDVYVACDILKQRYRASNSKIDNMRREVDVVVKACVANPGRAYKAARCLIWSSGTWLFIQLPSGRRLLYCNPKLETETEIDAETGKQWTWEYISYATARGKTWRREKAWSGLYIENIVQAIANDVLRGALLRVDAATLATPRVRQYLETLPPEERTAISLHVHDEIVLDVPVGSFPLARLIEIATAGERWSPGLPLHAEGWSGPRYGKR